MKTNFKLFLVTMLALTFLTACQDASQADHEFNEEHTHESDKESDTDSPPLEELGCIRPTAQQRDPVNLGNEKKDEFLDYCRRNTGNSPWCNQLVRPNPNSKNTFRCTYGANQVHQLIHPSEQTWVHAVRGVQLIQELAKKGIRTCEIYNWWRPEPYNKNVGGAAGRHPYGTSIDVRLCSNKEAISAFNELCKLRKKGKIRAIGYYGGSSLHFGVGDRTANTWGKSCR